MKVALRVTVSVFGLIVATAIFISAYIYLAINALGNQAILGMDPLLALILLAGVLVLGLSLYGLVSAVRIGKQGRTL